MKRRLLIFFYLAIVVLSPLFVLAPTASAAVPKAESDKADTYCDDAAKDAPKTVDVGSVKRSCRAGFLAGFEGGDVSAVCKNGGKGPDGTEVVTSFDTCKTAFTAGKTAKSGGTVKTVGADTASNSDASDDTDDSSPGLDCHAGFNPLNWLLCPVVKGLVSIVGEVDNLINSQMTIGSEGKSDNPDQIFCKNPSDNNATTATSSCQAYYKAWSSFRNIALALLVVVGITIIGSQALGLEFLDAYAIRKAMPRLIFAAIAITLSWQLMQFFVTLTNDLGLGIAELIYAPFRGLPNATIGGGSGFAIELTTGAAVLVFQVVGLLSFALTAALAVLVAFMVMIIRQLVVIVLILIAPIALVLYILPNTQNMFKIWWDSFMKALMMFPIITAFIATGHVFAVVSAANKDASLGQLVGFVAYFMPYFLLPLTFRFAGGAIRGIGGFVNDRSRGGFDRLRKYRGNQAATQIAKSKNFSRFSDSNAVGRGANAALGVVANPRSVLGGRRGVLAARSAGRTAHGAGTTKENQIFQSNAGKDAFYLAVANEDLAQKKLGQAMNKSQDMSLDESDRNSAQQEVYNLQRGIDSAHQMGRTRLSAGVRENALMELTKTGYQLAPGAEGIREIQDTVRSITGGDERASADMMDSAQYYARSVGGRGDLGGINHGATPDIKGGVRKMDSFTRGRGKGDTYVGGAEAWLGINSNARDATGQKLTTQQHAANISTAIASTDKRYKDVNLDSVAEWHGMLSNDFHSATDANKAEIQKQLDAIENLRPIISPISGAPSISPAEHDEFTRKLMNNKRMSRGGVDPSSPDYRDNH